MDTRRENWSEGLVGEIHFWELFKSYHPDWFTCGLDKTTPLDTDIDKAVAQSNKTALNIMDVGCGMMSGMGHVSNTGKAIAFFYADPLANEFKRIADEQGFTLPHPVTCVCVEYLCGSFPPMDVIYCRNALDHTFDPERGLLEMEALLEPNGALVLKHYYRCGQRNNYQGVHQWNIFDEDGSLYLEGYGTKKAVDSILSSLKCQRVERYTEGTETLVKAVYNKNTK